MERSQSFNSLDASNNNNDSSLSCENNLRKALELRQAQLQLPLQQHAGSGDNLSNSNNKSNTNLTNFHALPLPERRKLLQRQKSAEYSEDLNYTAAAPAASHEKISTLLDEEEDDDEEDYEEEEELRHDDDDDDEDMKIEHTENNIPQHLAESAVLRSSTPPPSHKHVRFQKQKPISDSALLKDDAAAALKSKSVEAHINTLAEDVKNNNTTGGTTTNTPAAITVKHPLKHKQSSFDSALLRLRPTAAGIAALRNPCNAPLKRDNSMHSDSSCYSSVDSLLEARKPDPEAILINLGFGPMPGSEDILSKIPKRFLKPSQVRGIDTDAFVKRIQLAHCLADHSSLGYRGLIGNPDVRPSSIVSKIMERFEVNQRKKSMGSAEHTIQ